MNIKFNFLMSKFRRLLPYFYFILLTALILDAGNPFFDKPSRDGGFFLYAGSQILSGKIPYLDFWDSKGPAIFYINALGVSLGQGSRWGIWGLEFIFIFVWMFVLYNSLSRKWGEIAALFGVSMAALGLRVVIGYGNYTEEYALLFNTLGLWLFLSLTDHEEARDNWKFFWIGVLFGLSFSFRANNIGGLFGILLSVFIFYLLKHNIFKAAKIILIVLTGFIAPLLLWVLYFQFYGAAQDMIFASVIYNFTYASAKSREFLDYFGGFGRYGMSWVGWFTAFGYLFCSYGVFKKIIQHNKISFADVFLFLWFPIEIFLSNLSGRNFSHYYISWALSVAFYCAAVFAGLTFYIQSEMKFFRLNVKAKQGMLLFLVFGLFVLWPASIKRYSLTFRQLFFNYSQGIEYSDQLSEYVQAHTQQDDLVLTWYPEMALNFMSERMSPVRFVYYPLFLEGTLPAKSESEYIKSLAVNQPEVIIDCSLLVNAVPSLDIKSRKEQFSKPGVKKKMYIQPAMEEVFAFVSENYRVEDTIESCIIFRLNSDK